MRPELSRRFCGRCGEACGGFEEPAPSLDPPRICASCWIEAHRSEYWLSWTLALVARILVVPLALVAAWQAIGLFADLPWTVRDLRLLGPALLVGSLFAIGVCRYSIRQYTRLLAEERERVRMIEEWDARPPREPDSWGETP